MGVTETGEPDAANDNLVASAVTSILPENDTHKLEESFVDMDCVVDVILPDYAAGPVKFPPVLMGTETLLEMDDSSTDSDGADSDSTTHSDGDTQKDSLQ